MIKDTKYYQFLINIFNDIPDGKNVTNKNWCIDQKYKSGSYIDNHINRPFPNIFDHIFTTRNDVTGVDAGLHKILVQDDCKENIIYWFYYIQKFQKYSEKNGANGCDDYKPLSKADKLNKSMMGEVLKKGKEIISSTSGRQGKMFDELREYLNEVQEAAKMAQESEKNMTKTDLIGLYFSDVSRRSLKLANHIREKLKPNSKGSDQDKNIYTAMVANYRLYYRVKSCRKGKTINWTKVTNCLLKEKIATSSSSSSKIYTFAKKVVEERMKAKQDSSKGQTESTSLNSGQ